MYSFSVCLAVIALLGLHAQAQARQFGSDQPSSGSGSDQPSPASTFAPVTPAPVTSAPVTPAPIPTNEPTSMPTSMPSMPTMYPTFPTANPTGYPTNQPTVITVPIDPTDVLIELVEADVNNVCALQLTGELLVTDGLTCESIGSDANVAVLNRFAFDQVVAGGIAAADIVLVSTIVCPADPALPDRQFATDVHWTTEVIVANSADTTGYRQSGSGAGPATCQAPLAAVAAASEAGLPWTAEQMGFQSALGVNIIGVEATNYAGVVAVFAVSDITADAGGGFPQDIITDGPEGKTDLCPTACMNLGKGKKAKKAKKVKGAKKGSGGAAALDCSLCANAKKGKKGTKVTKEKKGKKGKKDKNGSITSKLSQIAGSPTGGAAIAVATMMLFGIGAAVGIRTYRRKEHEPIVEMAEAADAPLKEMAEAAVECTESEPLLGHAILC